MRSHTTTTKRRTGLFGSRRGAVYTEAVILIPFLIMVWGFMIFTHQITLQKIRANSHAKGCTWIYAVNYCDAASLPSYCTTPRVDVRQEAPADWNDEHGRSVGAFFNEIGKVLGSVLGAPGYGSESREVRRPNVLTGGAQNIRARHSVSCNEKPRSPSEVFSDIWSSIKSKIFS